MSNLATKLVKCWNNFTVMVVNSKSGDSANVAYSATDAMANRHKLGNMQDDHVDNSYQFVENGGKHGQIKAYRYTSGQLVKVNREGAASSITYFFKDLFKQIFLPVGYPDSVSDDYMTYQIWDTIQAFCSTITGTFTTQSILKSVGVGDETATALGAATTWVIKDGSGMVGRILFAWWQGNSLDADCKSWRLFADILNDVALAIEFTLPYWQFESTMYVLCATSTMKSIVGVAGGATRAAITQHQAIQGNMGDVSAKDGSQETCVNLLASICGIFLLTYCQNHEVYLVAIFIVLTFMHIYANYNAVRCLIFKHLNFTRLHIVFRSYLQFDAVSNPSAVNKLEPVFTGFNRNSKSLCGFDIKMGHSLQKAFASLPQSDFDILSIAFHGKHYIIVPCFKHRTLYIGFAHKINSELTVRAYFHAVLLGMALSQYNNLILNIRTKRQLHHVTPLQRLNNLMKNFPRNQSSTLQIFSLEKFIEFNDFINGESLSFFTALSVNNWELSNNSLQVGEWRCNLNEDDEVNTVAEMPTHKKDN